MTTPVFRKAETGILLGKTNIIAKILKGRIIKKLFCQIIILPFGCAHRLVANVALGIRKIIVARCLPCPWPAKWSWQGGQRL
jgi:hypothetical protein